MKRLSAIGKTCKKWLGMAPLFDPRKGKTAIEPLSSGRGWWAGACSALYDDEEERFYLYHRLRKPRELGRGVECRIAESTNGIQFKPIWSATKAQLNTSSMERAALVKTLEGTYRLYISFVDPEDNKWRIDMMEADAPKAFAPNQRVKILTADNVGVEGVKDPYVMVIGRKYYMILSYAPKPRAVSEEDQARMHATADVYNTGITKSSSALAVSSDGIHFQWRGDIFAPPDEGWDAYATRLGCVLYTPPVFTAFYDGSAHVGENYEERTGMAISFDLLHYEKISEQGPVLVSPHGSGSLRYMDAIPFEDRIFYYYEYARPDGSHELRVNSVSLEGSV